MMLSRFQLDRTCQSLRHGATIAYPTEGVYGLGCLPNQTNAIEQLLLVKNRPWQKGLLLVGSDLQQFSAFITPLKQSQQQRILSHFAAVVAGNEHPTTWIVPAKDSTSQLLRGRYQSLGIRLCAHPLVQQICNQCDSPLVSSSANISKQPPARNAYVLKKRFRDSIDIILSQPTLGYSQPSTIKTIDDETIIRDTAK